MSKPAYDFESVREHAAGVGSARRCIVQELLRASRHIALARRRLDGDQFEAFLADVGYTLAEGELLSRLEGRFQIQDEDVDGLTPGGALALAGDDVPPAAIAEALAAARHGELITYQRAAQLIARHPCGRPAE